MWMLSIFAAFGLLIFGSLPFTNISEVQDGAAQLRLGLGLGLAALGLAVAVLAASTVFEPAITSLGELDTKFRTRRSVPQAAPTAAGKAEEADGGKVIPVTADEAGQVKGGNAVPDSVWRRAWRSVGRVAQPRRSAMRELRDVLEGDEAEAHLGPDVRTVKELIVQLQELDRRQYDAAKKASRALAELGALDKAFDAHTSTLTSLEGRLKSINDLPPSVERKRLLRDLRRTIAAESGARATVALERAKAANDAAAVQAELEEEKTSANEYLGHRQLVLVEAHVYRMRGVFRLARRRMVLGAFVTLAGATLYASVLPPEKSEADEKSPTVSAASASWQRRLSATVTVYPDQPAARQVPKSCVGRPLPALREGEVPPEKGPFTVLVTDAKCPGELTVPENQGEIVSEP
jgi:hypothetical protein